MLQILYQFEAYGAICTLVAISWTFDEPEQLRFPYRQLIQSDIQMTVLSYSE